MKRGPYRTLKRRLYAECISTAREANKHIDPESRATVKALMTLLDVIEHNDTSKLRALIGE